MKVSPTITIWKKELKDTIRDRKTLFSMVLMPMILMPVIIIGMSRFVQWQMKHAADTQSKVAVANSAEALDFVQILKSDDHLVVSETSETGDELKQAVNAGTFDLAVIIPNNFTANLLINQPESLTVLQKSTRDSTSTAMTHLGTALALFNSQQKVSRLASVGVDPKILADVTIKPEDVASQQEVAGFVLGFILPLFIVMWSIVGGQYTAIDVSAGEKERKTLEALLLTPAKRLQIVVGKFLAVATVAAISVILAISSMYVAFTHFGFDTNTLSGTNLSAGSAAANNIGDATLKFSLPASSLAVMIIVALFLVGMFSSLLLSLAIYARNYKEAQSYIGPAYLVVVLPVVTLNMMPSLKMPDWLFAIPAVNGVGLFKELLLGTFNNTHILITVLTLIIYSLAALWLASIIYQKETVLFKD